MIRFGLRLSLRGGRESVSRLVVMALAVALGVAMLLATISIMNALSAQNSRGAWLATQPAVTNQAPFAGPPAAPSDARDALWWLVSTEEFRGQVVVRVDVAAQSVHSLVPPGIVRLPRPGQYYVSGALATLLRTTPADQLRDRFAGREVGRISPSALASPHDLIIIIGDRAGALSKVPAAGKITGFATSSSNGGPDSLGSTGLEIILGILGLVLLLPVLVFIGTATRLSAARREQRYAAMRLAGATTRQVAMIAATEAVLAAVVGVAVGFAVFALIEPAIVHIPLSGQPFDPGDVSLNLADALIVALGVPLATAFVARAALRRVRISPLGVSRRVTPTAPRAFRVIPLVAGVIELSYFVAVGHPSSSGSQIEGYFLGFLLVMVGLVLAGPWLTMKGALLLASRTDKVPSLIAGRRLSDNPRASFRAVSGLILAIFVTSVSVGVISTLLTDHGSTSSGSAASKTVTEQFDFSFGSDLRALPSHLVSSLRATKGVTGVSVVYGAPKGMRTSSPVSDINGLGGQIQDGLVRCSQLRTTPALGRCSSGARFAALDDDVSFMPLTKSVAQVADVVWPRAEVATATARPVQVLAVATNGSVSAVARAETALDAAFPYASEASLFGEIGGGTSQMLSEMKTSSEVVILASLLIAGCSLAIAMASGVSERRRPFGLLRVAGVPLRTLRKVVALETAAPLVVISLSAALLGLLTAELFLRAQLGLTLRAPGLAYALIVAGGLTGSLAVIALTLPLLNRLTRPQDVRME